MKYTKWAPALVLAGLVAACDQSPVGPSPTPQFAHDPGAAPSAPTAEQLTVCKVGSSASFTVSYNPAPGTAFVTGAFDLDAGDCVHIATSGAIATATIVETSAQTGFHLASIDVQTAGTVVTAPTTDVPTSTAVVTFGENPDGAGGVPPSGATVTFYNEADPPPPPGDEGCTPGYWKQLQHFDSWEGYATGDDFDTVFGVDLFNPDITLIQALNLGGGGVNALARHAVAALLNAASSGVDSFYTEAEVIQIVQDAETSGDFESAKNLLNAANELGCPLN